MKFKLSSKFKPAGDQGQAIKKLNLGIEANYRDQTLLGVTGSGKTFTMANIIAKQQRPTLIIAHNKTLAAQLASEFKEFFPDNAVHYFVSYYDYYQPEAYIPRSDTYIEKETSINDEIDRLRHAATFSLLTRKDVIIVASVSCIYGLGEPEDYLGALLTIKKGQKLSRQDLIHQLVDRLYERNDVELSRGKFQVRGDIVEIVPSYEEEPVRIEFFGNEVEKITKIDGVTGNISEELKEFYLLPAKHFVTSEEALRSAIKSIRQELDERLSELKKQNKLLEAQRLEQRTNYDLEMMQEMGYVNGIENYSRHLTGRKPGQPPSTLIDFFPSSNSPRCSTPGNSSFLLFIDESHMTIPQIGGMYYGDKSRKDMLIEHGFRLPSARDNRPLRFEEFDEKINQAIYVSATPAEYEIKRSTRSTALGVPLGQIVEQIIRPTGLLDPKIEIKPVTNQVDDLMEQIRQQVKIGQRTLVTTLTKKLSERLASYLEELGIKVAYLHSDIVALDRLDILRDLRAGVYDVLVGINLLREGLDLPEVSLVAILDADKEGFLRSEQALIQTMGRAARHKDGRVIMYADSITGSMKRAIDEVKRRRKIQEAYNKKHGITPTSIEKDVPTGSDWRATRKDVGPSSANSSSLKLRTAGATKGEDYDMVDSVSKKKIIKLLEKKMDLAARNLEFERAAELRDQIEFLKQ